MLPLANPILEKHILQTFNDASTQVRHALQVKGRARSGYYRAAILLSSAVVEAVLYDFIDVMCQRQPLLVQRVKRFKKTKEAIALIELPKTQIGSLKELWICEINRAKIDRTHGFKDMNDFALELGIISKRLYNRLEFVCNKRNEIHLQTLASSSRNYNSKSVDKISDVFLRLLNSY